MNDIIARFAEAVLAGRHLQRPQVDELLTASTEALDDLLYWSGKIRRRFFGNAVRLCSIVPGRLGGCSQDCAFCAQSARYNTAIDKTPRLLSEDQVMAAAVEAKKNGVPRFGIVYSGKAVSEEELSRLETILAKIVRETGLKVCAALGIIDVEQARRLAAAGVTRYNHNIETSENHFPKIVTTHTWAQRVAAIRAAQAAGLDICAGGIFGIGETEADRVDMALALRALGVDTVPMNFLHPIPGTPLADVAPLKPLEILRTIALYRFIMPQTHLKLAGGRVSNLRDLQSWAFQAGATSILTGDYLTTAGRSAREDIRMLKDAGLSTADN